jgi:hypothetical protein
VLQLTNFAQPNCDIEQNIAVDVVTVKRSQLLDYVRNVLYNYTLSYKYPRQNSHKDLRIAKLVASLKEYMARVRQRNSV